MTNPRASGKRPTDWGEFYKNGQPKEVIVIDDDTPPPSTLPQSSSSRYMPSHANNSHGSSSYNMSSQIPVPTASGRITRRTNKRLPSTDLSPNGSIVPRPQANSQYTYQATAIYPSRNQQHLATSSAYSINGVNSLPGSGTTYDAPPAKKKRKSNAGLKYPASSTNYPSTYTAPSTSALKRDVQDPSNDWDDKDGHFIVHVGKEFTGRYEIVKLLGQGTFGKVVECKDLETGNRCAIKIIRAVQKYRDASKIEARVLSTLKQHDPRNEYKSSQKYFVRGRLDFPNEETKNPSKKYVRALKPLSSFVEPPNNQASSLAFASDFIDLLRRLLCYDPAERITAAQALRHPYFSYLLNENGEVLATRKTS
ncbi:dual specificity protein kinase kns1 [Podila epicladia]|nr:dual specificity protein kinase kns1 [Podila epicladia]